MTNILTKLHAIMTDVGYIQKDKRNDFHGYRYASEYAIKDAIHSALVKHRVLFFVESATTSHVERTEYQTDKGRRSSLTDVLVKFRFLDIESGESLSGEFTGTGDDNADKGTYKAITGAIKYIMTSTFLIPTGDDPENESAETKAPAKKPAAPAKTAPAKPRDFNTLGQATVEQKKKVAELVVLKLGAKYGDGADILAKVNEKFGMSLTSANDLTLIKARTIIESLEKLPDAPPFE